MAKKPSMGRQNIRIAKIEIKNHLQLCTLCGVEIAIIVFSPAGKVFSFGHPNVESIIDMYIFSRNTNATSNAYHLVEAHPNASVCELNFQLTQVVIELEAENKRGATLDQMRKVSESQFWWEAPIEKLTMHELEQLKGSIDELKKNVSNQANKILLENNAPYFGGNSIRVFDEFESKPLNIINVVPTITSYAHSLGYVDGFF